MKRFISFLCMITLICTLVVPLSSVQVSAAAKDWYKEGGSSWTMSGGATRLATGEVFIPSGGRLDGRLIYKDKITISFSHKVNVHSNSIGVQIHLTPYVRAGFYIREGYVSSMDTSQRIYNIPNETGWHDYRFEIDYPNKIQTVYFDDELVGTQDLGGSSSSQSLIRFWAETGGSAYVTDVSVDTNEAAITTDPNELKLTQDYTEPFFQDFHEIGGWRVEPEPFVTHDAENGLLTLTTDPTEHQAYRSIERPLRPPTNFDVEFRAKRNYLGDDVTPGHLKFQISTGNRHAWISFFTDRKIEVNNYGASASDPHYDGPQQSFPYKVGYDWFTLRAEVRGEYITWFVNDEMLVSRYKINTTANNVWHISIFSQNWTGLVSQTVLDWVKYTPYFEDEIKITAPEGGSRFAEGSDIKLKAETPSGAEKIDYYLNDVYVGSGYKKDNYVYTLKNARVGTYSFVAKLANIETGKQVFSVEPSLDCKISLDRSEIVSGETATVTVLTDSINDNVKAAKVEFYADGNLVSADTEAPFSAAITKEVVGNSKIYAKVTDNKGKSIFTDELELKVNAKADGIMELSQEYEVNYSFASENGNLSVTDGYYPLNITHTPSGIIYKTKNGEKTYEGIGKGDFKVVVASGHAEIYWKGRYLESVLLPYEPTYKSGITSSGLADVKISATDAKSQLLFHKWNNEAEYDSGNLPLSMYYAIELDKTDSSPEELYFCDGTYSSVISFREDGIYARRDLTMTEQQDTEVKICDKVEPGCYRFSVSTGLTYVTCNNKQIGQFRARLFGGQKKVTRKMSNPSASTYISVKDNDDLYYFTEDFEENSEYSYAEYWMNKGENFRTKADFTTEIRDGGNGNHHMNISGTGVLLLNGIDINPSIKWSGMSEDASGNFYVQFRRSFGDARSRIGYDFAKKEWFFERRDENNKVLQNDRVKATTPLTAGEWHNFELICDDFDLKLMVDGKEAISAQIPYAYANLRYGRMGIGVEGGSFNFDDFEYIGKGRVVPGGYFSFNREWGKIASIAGYYEQADGSVATFGTSGSMQTSDNGRTWTSATAKITTSHFAVMPDGTWVKVTDDEQSMMSYVSKDEGANWSGPYRFAYGNSIGSANRLTCTMSGRLFMITNVKGSTEYFSRMSLFYSDDGINWHQSKPEQFNTYNTGIIGNENVVVDTPRENEVRMFARSDSGFLDYFVSYDNGVTFDPTPRQSQLMQAAVCFRVIRDWENPNTYYAVFGYDTESSNAAGNQYPRNRSSLAVSYDGMENWEYVTDIMEGSEVPRIFTTDHMLNLAGGTLFTRQTQPDSSDADHLIYSMETSKIKGIKRMPELHYRHFICYDVANTNGIDHVVLPKVSGDAWIFGSRADVIAMDGRYDLRTIENTFGVTGVQSGTTVVLTLGDAKITLTEGSKTYDVNGVTKTAEREVLVGGLADIKTMAEVFGKAVSETEDSYSILYQIQSVEQFRKTIDNLA